MIRTFPWWWLGTSRFSGSGTRRCNDFHGLRGRLCKKGHSCGKVRARLQDPSIPSDSISSPKQQAPILINNPKYPPTRSATLHVQDYRFRCRSASFEGSASAVTVEGGNWIISFVHYHHVGIGERRCIVQECFTSTRLYFLAFSASTFTTTTTTSPSPVGEHKY